MADQDVSLPRRSVLASTATAFAGAAFAGSAAADSSQNQRGLSTDADTISPLEFYYPNGLLDENEQPFLDDQLVAVEATSTADIVDAKTYIDEGEYTKDGSLTQYPEDVSIPLVAVDDRSLAGTVVGFGGLLVQDGSTWSRGNAEFVLNVLDATTRDIPNTQRVLLFESDGFYYNGDHFSKFRAYADGHGYNIVTQREDYPNVEGTETSGLIAALEAGNHEAVWLPVPNELNRADRERLRQYVENGGTVFLQDSSDFFADRFDYDTEGDGPRREYDEIFEGGSAEEGDAKENGPDPSYNLNQIADSLGIDFRFNDGVVSDPVHNNTAKGIPYQHIPITDQFNDDRFPWLFEDREGIEPNGTFYHFLGTVQSVDDGDTYTIQFDNQREYEMRTLGIDAPEDGGSPFERPVEWEGLADDIDSVPLIKKLQFEDACSLVSPNGGRLTDDDVVTVRAEPTATNENTDDTDEGYVDYGDSPIPLVATGDSVFGIGSLYVDNCSDLAQRQKGRPDVEFLQNVWDAYLGGGDTVLYDESHAQPKTLSDHQMYADSVQQDTFGRLYPKADYDLRATQDLLADIDDADAIWLTPPADPFTDAELARLQQFLDDGGALFVHGRADATGQAFTANLNAIVDAIDAPFRFNSDQVLDTDTNGGSDDQTEGAIQDCRQRGAAEKPQTTQFADRRRFPFFLLRQGEGFDGAPYNHPYLQSYAGDATTFAENELNGKRIAHELEPEAVVIGGLGRLYGYTYLEEEYPGGKTYARKALDAGLVRAYDSGHRKHDEYVEAEIAARVDDRELWSESDPARSEQIRNRPVEQLYFPQAASVRTTDGQLSTDRAPVLAEAAAAQDGDPTVTYDDAPLVGVDRDHNVALLGSPLVGESYEMRENDFRDVDFVNDVDPFWVNTANYENFVFVTNLLRDLTDIEGGSVLFDCGHDQFGGSVDRFGGNYSVSPEDARYLDRFLEGVGINCEGIYDIENNLTGEQYLQARALIVSTPVSEFTDGEIATLREFQDDGGAILFLGSAEAPVEETAQLNDVLAGVGTDLRLNDDQVLDDQHNLKGLARLPTTTNWSPAFADGDLFEKATVEPWSGPGDGLPKDAGGGDDGEQKPEMSASGSRSDDGAVFTRGQTNQVDVTIDEFADPVDTVAITDSIPEGWEVQPFGDAENSGDVRTVRLGTVSREELQRAEGGVTRTYFVEATGSTGRYTFGPATATAVNGEPVDPDSAEFGGTDTNTIVGIGQNGIGAGAWDGGTGAD